MGVLRDTKGVFNYVWSHPANRRQRLRGIGRAVQFQLRGRLGLPTLADLGHETKIWAELHQHAASKVVYANPPDWPEMQAWRRLLGPGDLFVDVGSNVGVYALWAAERGAEVIAVEPDAEAASRLRRNVRLNGARVEVLECALAAESGTMTLTSGQDCTNHLIVDAADSAGTSRQVPVRTLDEIVGDRQVAGVKVDVEGAERLVLAGGERALAEQRIRVLQLEWNRQSELTLGEDREPVAEILRRHGYVLTCPDSDGRLVPTEPLGYCADLFAVAGSVVDDLQQAFSK